MTWNVGALADGASASVDVTVAVDPSRTAELSNTASASSSVADPVGTNDSDTETTTVDPHADVSVTQTDAPDPLTVGGDVTYSLTVGNSGPSDAHAVVVTDTIPPATTFVSATPSQGTCNAASPVVCHLGPILAGNGASIALVVNAPNANGQITNTASVTNSPETDPTPTNNSSSVPTDVTGASGVVEIPTASAWGLLALAAALAGLGLRRLR